jgi:class 3 adenylate cyclase/pimeloyl-ACP methyl ester carboxylesterase
LTNLDVRYATTDDGVEIAYRTAGEGSGLPLLMAPPPPYTDVQWIGGGLPVTGGLPVMDERRLTSISGGMSRSRKLAWFDFRGAGMSDRKVDEISMETMSRDLDSVVGKLGWDEFALHGVGMSGPVVIRYAATHPDRVRALILQDTYARAADLGHIPRLRAMGALLRADYDSYLHLLVLTGYGWGVGPYGAELVEMFKACTTQDAVMKLAQSTPTFDATQYVPMLSVPTLVLGRSDSPVPSPEMTRRLGARIADARVAILSSQQAHLYETMTDGFLNEYDVIGGAAEPVSGTSIILFTDIVDSTALTERMGDTAFRAKSRELDAVLRDTIRECGGTVIDAKTLGDGVLATLPAASQAIDAALRCGEAGESAGLPLHLGLHAGDVIREPDASGRANVFGGAVNIAARISGLSAPSEVLVSDIVRGLARTSAGVTFEDRGEHALKGVAEPVRVFAVLRGGD